MKLSNDTIEIIKFLEYTTGNNLRKKNDLGDILEIAASNGNYKIIEDLMFYGKTLWNLNFTLKRTGHSNEDFAKLQSEAISTGAILKKLLNELLDANPDIDRKRFNDIYFADSVGAFKNLVDLAHDLAKLKELQITMKNKK